jgi:hypothetical protein
MDLQPAYLEALQRLQDFLRPLQDITVAISNDLFNGGDVGKFEEEGNKWSLDKYLFCLRRKRTVEN